jgi:hypothetical protein
MFDSGRHKIVPRRRSLGISQKDHGLDVSSSEQGLRLVSTPRSMKTPGMDYAIGPSGRFMGR